MSIQRLHLDETHGENRPYDPLLLKATRENVRFLNRERGADCSVAWTGSKAQEVTRAEQIRPWAHLHAPTNSRSPEYASIWRTWVLAAPRVKTVELDIWYRVSDPYSDPSASNGTGNGFSGDNRSNTQVSVRLTTPGALQAGGIPTATTLTPLRDSNGEELWQRTRLKATISPDYASAIGNYAKFLASLEIKSRPIEHTTRQAEMNPSSFPGRLEIASADALWSTPGESATDPLGDYNPWTHYVDPTGHPPVNLVAPGNDDFMEVDAVDFTELNGAETANIYGLSYIQIRAAALRTTYYDLGSQVPGADISEPETRAEQPARGGLPQKAVAMLNETKRRPEPLVIGTQGHEPNIDNGDNWGESSASTFRMQNAYHLGFTQSNAPSDIYTTMYDVRSVARRHITRAKVVPMGLIFHSTSGLDDPEAGWSELDPGILADVTWRATAYQVDDSGPTQLNQDTFTSSDSPVYLANAAGKVPILRQMSHLHPSGGVSQECYTEGHLDVAPDSGLDLPSGNPIGDFLSPELWCDISGRDAGLPLRFTLEAKFDAMTPQTLDFPSIYFNDFIGLVSCAFSVWGFPL